MKIKNLRQSFNIKNRKVLLSTVAALSILIAPFAAQNALAATTTVCASGCNYITIQAAVTAASSGDIIVVSDPETITSTVTINKELTIKTTNGSTITTSGSAPVFQIIGGGDGSAIEGFNINKTDNTGQQLVTINANNITIDNNNFTGQWTIGGGTVVRGIVVSPSKSNLTISNNEFKNLRQPAYIDGTTTGSITNNFVSHTKGWVVEASTNLNFSGNSWGTGADTNVIDVAIIPSATNNYPDNTVVQISDNNNDALVENQVGTKRLSDAYIRPVTNGNVGDEGSKWNPYTSIQSGLDRIVDGGTVKVANGSYSESFTFKKNGTTLVGESKAGVQITSSGITSSGHAIDITALSDVSFENATLNVGMVGNPGYHVKIYQSSGVTLENIVMNGRGSSYIPRTGGLDFNATSNVNVTNVTISNYSKNGVALTSKYASGDTASKNYVFNNVSASNNAWHGFAFYPFSSAVNADIENVSFNGSNSSSGNGQTGIIFAGAPDALIISGGTPTRTVTGPAGNPVNIDSFSISSNPIDVLNYQTADVEATSTVFNGKTGNTMTSAEKTAQNSKITDKLDNSQLGLVRYATPDTSAPSVPTNGQPHAAFKNTNDFYFTWGASTDDRPGVVSYEFQSSTSNSTDGNGSLVGAWNSIANGNSEQQNLTSPTIHSTGAGDNKYYWQVRAIDESGNKSAWSTVWNMTIDTQAPSAPNLTNPTNNQYFATTPILNDWTDSSDSNGITKYQVEYIYDDGHTFSGGPYRETPGNQSQRSHTPSTSEQGGVKVRVRAHDPAGNVSAWSNQVHYFYDATAPSVPTNGQPHNTTIPTNNFSFTWDASTDSSPVKYEFQSSLNSSQSGGVLNSGVWNNIANGNSSQNNLTGPSIPSVGAPDGKWYWQVRAIDAAGNKSNWSSIWNVTIDTQAPAAPTGLKLHESGGDEIANGSSTNSYDVTASWTVVSDAQRYEYRYWNSIPGDAYNAPNYYVVSVNNPTNSGVFNRGEGLHHFQVRAIDAAGNTSPWSAQFDVTYDNTPPVVTGINTVDTDTQVTPSIFADDPNGPLTFLWTPGDSSYASIISDPASLTPDFTPTADGAYNFTLAVTDAAGNTTTFPFAFTYTQPVAPTSPGGSGAEPFQITNFPIATPALLAAAALGDGITGIAANAGFAAAGQAADNGNAAVQGAQNEGNPDGSAVSGTATKAASADKKSNFPWWAIVAALVAGGLLWWLIARRKNQED